MSRTQATQAPRVLLRSPVVSDGKTIWTLARDSGRANASRARFYLLWCYDFTNTSLVTTVDDHVMGFMLGYRRQDHPDTLVVWHDAVNPACQITGLRLRMLNEVVDRNVDRGVRFLEVTAAPDDRETIRVAEYFAHQHDAPIIRRNLFDAGCCPDERRKEILYEIGPL